MDTILLTMLVVAQNDALAEDKELISVQATQIATLEAVVLELEAILVDIVLQIVDQAKQNFLRKFVQFMELSADINDIFGNQQVVRVKYDFGYIPQPVNPRFVGWNNLLYQVITSFKNVMVNFVDKGFSMVSIIFRFFE